MSSDVTDLIAALREGGMTLEQVAERFRQRTWPRRATPPPTTYLELAIAAQRDPEPYRPGSFDDVAAAHQEGKLSDHEYAALVEAVAESKRSEDRRRAEAAEPADIDPA
ncbi:MAG: hypothetical protein ACRDNZ_12280 [Streptosporangiaceae bacterium]